MKKKLLKKVDFPIIFIHRTFRTSGTQINVHVWFINDFVCIAKKNRNPDLINIFSENIRAINYQIPFLYSRKKSYSFTCVITKKLFKSNPTLRFLFSTINNYMPQFVYLSVVINELIPPLSYLFSSISSSHSRFVDCPICIFAFTILWINPVLSALWFHSQSERQRSKERFRNIKFDS